MQWGISFKIPYEDESKLANFPLPSVRIRYQTATGPSPYVTVMYLFEHAPQGWREMQHAASIKVQMKQLIPTILLSEEPISSHTDMDIEKIYTIRELGKFFKRFIKYPQPWYPQDKDEYMSKLVIYAKKLYYSNLYHFESVLAMAIFFNTKMGSPYSRRQVQKKALSVMRIDKSGWKRKLDKKALHLAHVSGGEKRGTQQTLEARQRCLIIKGLIPKYLKDNGRPDVAALRKATGLSQSTIYSCLKRIKAGEVW